MLKKIKYWLKYEARYFHKDFIQGIKNLWKWLPIIWKDRDWDDYYIWILLEKKLTYQSKYIGARDFHTRAKRDAEIMMTCVRLIKKVREEYYSGEFMDYHKSEYHFDPVPDKPDNSQLRIEQISENFDDYFKKYPLIYKKVLNTDKPLFNKRGKEGIAINISRINHDRARKILFKLLERNIESWWD
jgi:hypothetical protein